MRAGAATHAHAVSADMSRHELPPAKRAKCGVQPQAAVSTGGLGGKVGDGNHDGDCPEAAAAITARDRLLTGVAAITVLSPVTPPISYNRQQGRRSYHRRWQPLEIDELRWLDALQLATACTLPPGANSPDDAADTALRVVVEVVGRRRHAMAIAEGVLQGPRTPVPTAHTSAQPRQIILSPAPPSPHAGSMPPRGAPVPLTCPPPRWQPLQCTCILSPTPSQTGVCATAAAQAKGHNHPASLRSIIHCGGHAIDGSGNDGPCRAEYVFDGRRDTSWIPLSSSEVGSSRPSTPWMHDMSLAGHPTMGIITHLSNVFPLLYMRHPSHSCGLNTCLKRRTYNPQPRNIATSTRNSAHTVQHNFTR